jgi:macrolide-specific efflux system membrane fusion protein
MANEKEKIKNYFLQHKIRIFIIVALLAVGGYFGYQKLNPVKAVTQYITETAQKTTITVTVSGSGQVSELNSIELKSQGGSSGSNVVIKSAPVKTGDMVKEGQIIAVLDPKNNLVSLNQARATLVNAQNTYTNLLDGPTDIEIKLQENSIKSAETSYNNALTSLENTKKSTALSLAQAQQNLDDLISPTGLTQIGINTKRDAVVSNIEDVLISLRNVINTEDTILNNDNLKQTLSVLNLSYLSNAKQGYDEAEPLLNIANNSLGVAKLDASDIKISQAVNDANNILNKLSYSLNNLYSALQNTVTYTELTQTQLDAYKTSVNSQINTVNSGLSSIKSSQQSVTDAILSQQNSIKSARNSLDNAKQSADQQITSAKQQIVSAQNSLQSAKDNLTNLKEPATKKELDAALSQIQSARAQLQQAQEAVSNDTITAPFDGKIAVMNVQKGDQVAQSTVIATLITRQEVAIVPLNEVDVTKINFNDKAVLTFDAVDGLSITGKVVQIDNIGTVSQGVVNYNVQISFDTLDDRVKPGMSVSAEIITDVATNVLAVPNAAVKTDNGTYVQLLNKSGQPQDQTVVIGVANDTMTEIVSGINEGDEVVTQTITTSGTAAATSNTQQRSSTGGIRIPGLGGGGRPD